MGLEVHSRPSIDVQEVIGESKMELEDHMQISKGADPRIPSRNRLRVHLGLLHKKNLEFV